jgi:hypothetical protein
VVDRPGFPKPKPKPKEAKPMKHSKPARFIKVSSHKILGHSVTLWCLAPQGTRAIAISPAYNFTATLDHNGRPVRPGRDAHMSFDAQWACNYLRRQLQKAVPKKSVSKVLVQAKRYAKGGGR